MPPARAGTLAVSPRDALTLDAVYRAVSIIETAALQLTLDVWRGQSRIPTPSLADKPNVDDHGGAFWAETVGSLALRGNAYWRKHRGSDGMVINLECLDPLEVLPYRDRHGRKLLAWRGKDYTDRDIAHLKLLRVPGEQAGLGPIQATARGLRGHLDVATYGSNWFRTGETPSGVLSTEQTLTAAQAAEWKAQWKAQQTSHDTAVLGNGLKYAPIALKPSEVQWLESQRFGVTGIARLFGIPSRQLLVALEGSSTTYANAEQEDIAFVRYTLMAYLREMEQVMSGLLPRGQTARFNVNGLLRTDTKTRYEAHEIGIRAGFLSAAEVRAIEGLDPATAPQTAPAPQEAPA